MLTPELLPPTLTSHPQEPTGAKVPHMLHDKKRPPPHVHPTASYRGFLQSKHRLASEIKRPPVVLLNCLIFCWHFTAIYQDLMINNRAMFSVTASFPSVFSSFRTFLPTASPRRPDSEERPSEKAREFPTSPGSQATFRKCAHAPYFGGNFRGFTDSLLQVPTAVCGLQVKKSRQDLIRPPLAPQVDQVPQGLRRPGREL